MTAHGMSRSGLIWTDALSESQPLAPCEGYNLVPLDLLALKSPAAKSHTGTPDDRHEDEHGRPACPNESGYRGKHENRGLQGMSALRVVASAMMTP
jgi:hypothetical protein